MSAKRRPFGIFASERYTRIGEQSRGSSRVNRGGSWNNQAENCTAANRNANAPTNANQNLGFRLLAAPLDRGGTNGTDCFPLPSIGKGKMDERTARWS
jgi:hypothetical protein